MHHIPRILTPEAEQVIEGETGPRYRALREVVQRYNMYDLLFESEHERAQRLVAEQEGEDEDPDDVDFEQYVDPEFDDGRRLTDASQMLRLKLRPPSVSH